MLPVTIRAALALVLLGSVGLVALGAPRVAPARADTPAAPLPAGKPLGDLGVDLRPRGELAVPGAAMLADLRLQPFVDTTAFRVTLAATGTAALTGAPVVSLGGARAGQELITTIGYRVQGSGAGEVRVTVDALGAVGQLVATRLAIVYVLGDADAVLHGTAGHLDLQVRALNRALAGGRLTPAEHRAAMDRALGAGAQESVAARGGGNSITVSGRILWTDSAGGTHPVRSAPVEIHDTRVGTNPVGTATTDANGNYSAVIATGTNQQRDIFIRVLARGPGFTVSLPDGTLHRIDSPTQANVPDMTMLTINLTANNTADNTTAFSVHDALVTITQYVQRVRGSLFADIGVVFPTTRSTSLYDGTNLHLLRLDRFDWDVIHHEYGHYVMDQLNIENSPGGSHSSSENLGERLGKDAGIRLAWGEGWPTYFGTVAQQVMGTAAFGIPNVGDTRYQDTEDASINYDLENQAGRNSLGEDNELSVQRILWDLFDAANDTGDTGVALGDTAIWNILDAADVQTLSAAYQALIANRGVREVAQIGCIVTEHRVAPGPSAPAAGGFAGTTPPAFSWAANGGGPSNLNNAFIVQLYDATFANLLLATPEQAATSFTPTQAQWDAVLAGAGGTVNWLVRGRQTNTPATGPYLGCSRTLLIDTVPPTTTASPSPASNGAGWNNTNVDVGLSAVDNAGGSGVREIVWSLTGAQTGGATVSGSNTTVTVSAEGTSTLGYFARDNVGNTEGGKSLTLRIDKTPPVITASATTADGQAYPPGKWTNQNVTVRFTCTDTLSGVASISATGAANGTSATSPLAVTVTTEGANQTVTGACTDVAGNTATASFTGINIDKTPPMVSCSVSPNSLWPPNHMLVPVTANVTVTDLLSGSAGFKLLSASSNEPDNGLGDGNTSNDIQGWIVGTDDTSGQLRAERSGGGAGRIYTLRYEGSDLAGNTASCMTTVTVQHNQR